jgi:hypothetical protein
MIATFASLGSVAHADLGVSERPSVNVTGEAEIRVAPDLAVLRVRVQHCGEDLVATRLSNQQSAKAVLAAVREVGGKAEDQASTPSMSFAHRYNCPEVGEKERETGHTVTTELTLRLESMEQIDPLLNALSVRPEVQLQDVEYRTTELRRYRDEVRAKAIHAAREKAQALAVELGQNIGPAILINADSDNSGGFWSWSQFGGGGGMQFRGAMTQNVMMDAGGNSGGSELAASGKITVRATVNVRFELRP